MTIRRSTVIVLLLALAVFIPVMRSQSFSNVQCIMTGTSTSIGACIGAAFPLSLIGLGLSLMVLSIAYMAGEILNYEKLKGFYKSELWETIKSALIIAIIFSSLVIVSAIAVAIAGVAPSASSGNAAVTSNLANLYSTATTMYLTPQLQQSYTALSAIFGLSVGTDVLRTLSFGVWLPIPLVTEVGVIGSVQSGASGSLFYSNYITPFYGQGFLKQVTTFSTALITSASAAVLFVLLSLEIQRDMLLIIAELGLGVFIPIGIIMRAIPLIRGIGGTMIAVGIGLSIVYPALLVGLNIPVTNYMYTLVAPIASSSSCPPSFPTLICTVVWNPFAALLKAVPGLFTGAAPLDFLFGSSAVSKAAITASGYGFYTGLVGPFGLIPPFKAQGIIPALNFVIDNGIDQILQFLLFIIDIIIGVAITGGIASLLGGSLRLGVGKFKLV